MATKPHRPSEEIPAGDFLPSHRLLRKKLLFLPTEKDNNMHGVSININLPTYGNYSPEELTRKVRQFAIELVSPKEKSTNTPPCSYTEEEVEKLLNERMQSIEDGTAEFVSHDEVKARIKAMLA